MDIEQVFAAEVIGAGRAAAVARKCGYAQTVADHVAGAVADLWACGLALGHSAGDIRAIVERWTTPDGEPRDVVGNVLPLPRVANQQT